jgi:WD40 repeat protein
LPKCLVAEAGWVCCGGENGDFTTIRLESRAEQTSFGAGVRADADSRLPLDLGPVRGLESSDRPDLSTEHLVGGYPTYVKATKIGEELVNCVTLWCPPSDTSEQTYSKPVAVLSSNDHTVAIVDLETRDVLERLELDDCVNRAVISPDGRLLVAIGDDPYMHVYQRKHQGLAGKPLFEAKSSQSFGWVKCQQIHLRGQRSTDKSEMRGSFATAFSASGRYLAVGTQYGIISVFETRHLISSEADPLVVTFTTSRPNQRKGAVRAMEFSPEPYDLLAWTEDHGRVTVADIRDHFMSRQVITMDPKAEGVERVGVIERSDDLVIDPRLRQFRIDPDGNTSDSIGAEMERRQLRYLSREGLERLHSPLTAEETEVLEALQVSRRQREREASRQALTGVASHSPLVWSDLVDDIRSNWREHAGLRGTSTPHIDELRSNWRDHVLMRSSGALPSSIQELVSGSRSTDSLRTETLRAFINERNQERERRGQQPRRRGSVILAAAGTALNRDLQDASETQRSGDLATGRERVAVTPPRLPAIRSDSPNNPWAEIEALYNLAVDPPVDATTRMRIEIAADNRREYARRGAQRWRALDERDRLPSRLGHDQNGSSSLPLEPMETTGCCWSQDGKILYVSHTQFRHFVIY